MPTLPDIASGTQQARRSPRRRWARRQVVEIRRSQEIVWRIWLGGTIATAVPIALILLAPRTAGQTWLSAIALWAVALLSMGLFSLYAAVASRLNARLLDCAMRIRSEEPELAIFTMRSASVRTLELTAALFFTLGGAHGTLGLGLGLEFAFPEQPGLLALAPLTVALLIGLLVRWTASSALMNLDVLAQRSPGTSKQASTRDKTRSEFATTTDAERQGPATPRQYAPSSPSPVASPALQEPPSNPEMNDEVEPETIGRRAPNDEAFVLDVSPNSAHLADFLTRELRPSNGAVRRPLAEPRRTQSKSRVELLTLSRPKLHQPMTLEEADSDSEAPESRDTSSPEAGNTEPAGPAFFESEIPTTPAPARVNESESEAPNGSDRRGSTPLPGYEVAIPRSPRTPAFEHELWSGRRRVHAERQFSADELERSRRPTTRVTGVQPSPASSSPAGATLLSRQDVRSDAVTQPPPSERESERVSFFSRAPGERSGPPSQFELAYNSWSGPQCVERESTFSQTQRESSQPPPFDSSVPPRPLDSEVRWAGGQAPLAAVGYESTARIGAASQSPLEQGLLDAIHGGERARRVGEERRGGAAKKPLH